MRFTNLVFAFLTISSSLFAEAPPDSFKDVHYLSIDGGWGLGLLGYQYTVGAAYRVDGTIIGVRFMRSGEIKVLEIGPVGGGTTHFRRPVESISEFCAYVGRTTFNGKFRLTGLIGLAFSSGTLRGNFVYNDSSYDHFEDKLLNNFTFPVEGQLTFIPYDYFGVSLSYYANFNAVRKYRGFIFGVQFALH